ncbi:MAG: glycosyltransferase family 2 protein [Cyanobacteria bacterium J06642_12]
MEDNARQSHDRPENQPVSVDRSTVDRPSEFVEIVLASYAPNLDFFAEQVQSLQQQTWPHWHCHIVDDGSPTETLAGMQSCLNGDRRFTLHSFSNNVGVYRNFERGLALCSNRATAIALCDQDDSWHPHKLERLLNQLCQQHAVLVHSDLETIDRCGRTLHPSCWAFERRTPEAATIELLSIHNVVTGCSCLFRPNLLAIVLPFPDFILADCLHDWWIALVAAACGHIGAVHQPLVRYRQHEHNVVGAVNSAGTLPRLAYQWSHNRFRITGKGYAAYRELTDTLAARMAEHALPPISLSSSGLHFAHLAWLSRQTRYGAEGTALRLAALALLAGDIF